MSTAASNDHTTDDGKETKSSSSQSSRSPERRTDSDHESNKEQDEEDASQQWQMDTSDFPSPKRLVLVMVGLFLALFAANLDTTILATAIPYITTEFMTIRDVSWYAAAIMLVSAAFQSTWGKIFRYFPIKIMFLFSILIFEVGSLICALAPTSTALVVGRAITGLGASGMTAGVFTLIAFSAPPKHVPAYMGLGGATYALASLAGPLLGGAFTENVTWRWCFWINLPIGAVTVGVMILVYRTPKAAQPQQATWKERILQMDLVGTFLIMAAVVCFILAFQWGGSVKSWSDSTVIGTIVGFVAISAVFVANEIWMQERAVLVPRLMKMRRIWANNAHVFCVSGGFFVLIYYISIFFQSVQGRTPIQSGVRSLPINIGCFLSIASGMIVTAYGRLWAPLMTGGAILATIGAGLIYTWDLNTSIGEYIGYQVLTGIGTGITLQIPLMANQAAVTPMEISTISAVTIFFQIIGGAFSLAAAQAAFASTLVSKVTQYAPGIDAANLLNVGASDLDLVYQGAELDAVLRAYMDGIKVTFALATALLGVSVLLALVPKWGELRPQQATTKTKDGKPDSSEDAV